MDTNSTPVRPRRKSPSTRKPASAPAPEASTDFTVGLTPEQLRAVFDQAVDAICIADEKGRLVDANSAAASLLGLSRLEILGKTVGEAFSASADFEAAWKEAIAAGRGELTLTLSQGEERVVQLVAAPGSDARLAILRDVTARKEVEAELLRQQQDLQDFVENAPVGLHWVGPDGVILWANPEELAMLGYSREEYVGHSIVDFHVDREAIDDILGRLRAGETIRQYEAGLRCKDGTVRQVQVSSNVKWEEGRFVHTRCFTRDVTERRRAQEASLEAQRQLSMALTAARMGTWSWNIQTGSLEWSDNLEEIHGMPPGSFKGTYESFLSCIHPDDRNLLDAGVRRAIAENSTYDVEFRVPFPDGTTHWVAGHGQVFVDAEGNPARMIGIGRDVTEKRRAAEDLANAYVDAQEALKIRDTFVAVAGHELRTPLGALGLTLHNLARRLAKTPDEAVTRSMESLQRQVDRLTGLTEDLLEVGRIRAGKLLLEREPMDLASLAAEVADRFRDSALAAGSTLDVALDGPVVGHWDASRLDQVLTNLLANAVKFGEGKPIEVRVSRRAGVAVLTVRDSGIGVPSEDQARLFERFERAPAAKRYRGMGLGLWIARQIIEGHDGRISLESEAGKGSTFRVELPDTSNPDTSKPDTSKMETS